MNRPLSLWNSSFCSYVLLKRLGFKLPGVGMDILWNFLPHNAEYMYTLLTCHGNVNVGVGGGVNVVKRGSPSAL